MSEKAHQPILIVIDGPNGSGKTTVNASRIARRVMEGGHDVPITKIISRYSRSIMRHRLETGRQDIRLRQLGRQ